jgi:hypothetical protein
MATASAPALAPSLRRFEDLVAFSERRLADAFGGRIARFYAWGVAGSFGFLLLLGTGRPEVLLSDALVALAWIPGGLVALGAARDLTTLDDENGITALVRQRGYDARGLELARFLATARRLARTTGWPALALVFAAAVRTRSADGAVTIAAAAVGTAAFVGALSLLLASFARASALISGGRGRIVLVLAVLVPHLARALFPRVPSLPALLSAILELVVAGGGG